jgi:MFS superfamily sulfate permease-like transporter
MLIFRSEASIIYFNAEHVRDTVLARVRSGPPVHTVLGDLSTSPFIDLAGAEMLKALHAELHAMGIRLRLVEARSSVRDKLRIEGLEERLGRIDRFTTVADAVDSLQADAYAPNTGAPRLIDPPQAPARTKEGPP